MAFIGAQHTEETLVSGYDLTNGVSGWTSSNLIQFSNISIQLSYSTVINQPTLCVNQSHDNINWDCFYEELLPQGTDSLTIERNNFSGKYIQFVVKDGTGNGTIDVKLIAK